MESFKRNKDPLRSMQIGLTPERSLEKFKEYLKELEDKDLISFVSEDDLKKDRWYSGPGIWFNIGNIHSQDWKGYIDDVILYFNDEDLEQLKEEKGPRSAKFLKKAGLYHAPTLYLDSSSNASVKYLAATKLEKVDYNEATDIVRNQVKAKIDSKLKSEKEDLVDYKKNSTKEYIDKMVEDHVKQQKRNTERTIRKIAKLKKQKLEI